MTVRDLNEFIDGMEHEASMSGTVTFAKLGARGPITCSVDSSSSRFHYLRVNTDTGEAEMVYRWTSERKTERSTHSKAANS